MLTYADLRSACTSGGASVLTSVTELSPAAGPHASIAPAKFVERGNSVFAFETRYVDGEAVKATLLDSKQSSLNRCEAAISQDIRDGHSVMSKLPRLLVDYGNGLEFMDLELPHRAFDGHFRAGTIDGGPVTSNESYRAIRNSTTRDASALLNTSPTALVLGAWDSTRKSDQVRLRSALVGEIIGVLADQEAPGEQQQSKRGGARVDTLAMSVQLTPDELERIVDAQEDELSPNLVEKIRTSIKNARKSRKGELISASNLGLGGIPPMLENLGGVSCSRVIRSFVLSFATLRQLRFGSTEEGNVAARALLAAFGLAALARGEHELYLRANCDLVEAAAPVVTLDERFGNKRELPPLTVEAADALLEEAIAAAAATGVANWGGQILEIVGNPAIRKGAVETSEED
ncbi:type I-U CRISPR-associated protein Cas7 [Corynebacterium xerosis]|uniref:Type I-U CRISPR-associated protein Cas7 n=1 Tax=Corynebacterium xerosis TaxID=1725 RepID=A0A6B8U1A4_9CORY|nr:type I-U CRISPR-associated RAMP protein Csb1/Cas7u [Corynebacterium xerosis]QGS35395.1 type I-U CRISPR-associated protein Cas7 [Corynebacterium xerosis]